jgi:hypothetical protein
MGRAPVAAGRADGPARAMSFIGRIGATRLVSPVEVRAVAGKTRSGISNSDASSAL